MGSNLPPQFVEISIGSGVHHADDGVALALVHDPAWVDLAGEPLGVVVTMEVENLNQGSCCLCHIKLISSPYLDQFLAEFDPPDAVAVVVLSCKIATSFHQLLYAIRAMIWAFLAQEQNWGFPSNVSFLLVPLQFLK